MIAYSKWKSSDHVPYLQNKFFNNAKSSEGNLRKNLITVYSEEQLYRGNHEEGKRAACIDFREMPRARRSGVPTN